MPETIIIIIIISQRHIYLKSSESCDIILVDIERKQER